MPSSKYGTIFSFMYTRAGAPPGRTCAAGVVDSARGVFAAPVLLPGVAPLPMLNRCNAFGPQVGSPCWSELFGGAEDVDGVSFLIEAAESGD
jgi:hypothetical protein